MTPRELEAAVRGLRPPSPDSPTTSPRESLRILLAEDNRINQKVARAMLERAGHCVTLAEIGRIALERLEEAVFDVALVDIQMPEVDGFGVAREVRAREQAGRARTYLIALTAQAMAGDRELCLAAGFDTYLSKPISQNDLNAGLQTFLQSHRLSE